jgi:hypothetical protein
MFPLNQGENFHVRGCDVAIDLEIKADNRMFESCELHQQSLHRNELCTSYSSMGQIDPSQWLPRKKRPNEFCLGEPSSSSSRSRAACIIVCGSKIMQQ